MQDVRPPHADRTRHALPLAVLLLVCGFLLRLYFLQRHAFFSSDSILYQDIALNWLHHHIYGLSWQPQPRPTLIRLPGYPAILAAMAWLFDHGQQATQGTMQSFLPVLWLQIIADLVTCGLVGLIAKRMGGMRCGLVALAMACFCPFTSNYAVTPLTETFTLFFLVLAFYLLQHWLHDGRMRWVVPLAVAISCSALLRPDQGLLGVAIVPVLLLRNGPLQQRMRAVVVCLAIAAVPFAAWTARNYHVFHVIQPIAPKQAVDPGEAAPIHFEKWFRTWGMDFTSTQDAYWNYPEDPIDVNDLPRRAFDSPQQRVQTAALLQRAAAIGRLDPQVEAGFEALAQERIAAHPLRYY
ncbi:MAG: glycosyltransferase family 39 protein, partial [Terriglobus sp.]